MAHLLWPQLPREKQHPTFVELVSRRWLRSGRLLLQDAYERLPAREHDFIQRFQGEELDRRTFELFISELLHEAGATFTLNGPHPDFEPTVDGVSFALECATANPPNTGTPNKPYRSLNPDDADMEKLRSRVIDDLPTRFSSILTAKQNKRFKPGDVAYWDLPSVAGKPFVYAVQTFHEDGALSHSGSAITTYLYGIQHTPVFEGGKLVIRQSRVAAHTNRNGQSIPSGFFEGSANRFVSAVLWSNSGTIPKFARMALEGPYPDREVVVFRAGTEADPNPDAYAPLPFVYHVGTGGHRENWGEGTIVFHNPNAAHPLPRDLLRNVCNAYVDDHGRYIETTGMNVAHPFSSMTFGGHGPREIKAAELIARRYYETLVEITDEINKTRSSLRWDGFSQSGDLGEYRSDGSDVA